MSNLAGKVAVVTGAAQGLGAEFAVALAKAGAIVVLGDVASTDATCEAICTAGGRAMSGSLDVTSPTSVAALIDTAVTAFDRIDILVNNAAISGSIQLGPFTDITSTDWDRVMAVNVRGTFECIKAVTPVMKAKNYGKIINLSSGTATKGTPGQLHYVASKGAVISMTRAAARELGEFGICVNALAPGLTMSDAMRSNPSWSSTAIANNIASRALKSEAVPADLIGALLFLASSASDFVTGQTLAVDGGSVMN